MSTTEKTNVTFDQLPEFLVWTSEQVCCVGILTVNHATFCVIILEVVLWQKKSISKRECLTMMMWTTSARFYNGFDKNQKFG